MKNLQVLDFKACSLISTQHFSNQISRQGETGKIHTALNDRDQNNGVALHQALAGSASSPKYEYHGRGVSEAIHAHHAYLGVTEVGGSVIKGIWLYRMTVTLLSLSCIVQ